MRVRDGNDTLIRSRAAPQAELAPAAENADDDTSPFPQDPRAGHRPVESGTLAEPSTGLEVTGHDPPDPGGSGQLPEMPLPSTPAGTFVVFS